MLQYSFSPKVPFLIVDLGSMLLSRHSASGLTTTSFWHPDTPHEGVGDEDGDERQEEEAERRKRKSAMATTLRPKDDDDDGAAILVFFFLFLSFFFFVY